MEGQKAIRDLYNPSAWDRMFKKLCGCCVSKKNRFHGKELIAEYPDDPGNILWENLGETKVSLFFRRFFSWIITIALWIGTGVLIGAASTLKNSYLEKFPKIDCSSNSKYHNPTQSEAETDYLLGDLSRGLLECYCSYDLSERLNEKFPNADNEELCLTWFKKKIASYAITFGIVFAVIITNYLVEFFFRSVN